MRTIYYNQVIFTSTCYEFKKKKKSNKMLMHSNINKSTYKLNTCFTIYLIWDSNHATLRRNLNPKIKILKYSTVDNLYKIRI